MLRDPCGRPVTNLRISVTQECNQRCIYCHREGEATGQRAGPAGPESMVPGEIARIAAVAAPLGISKVKFTGGEPLTRKDFPHIVAGVAPHFKDVSLTTNGTLLSGLAQELRAAGLSRVNVSLDSVEPDTYQRITGTRQLGSALEGIRAASKAGLVPVKLNMVVLRGLNETEVPQMIRFAAGERAVLQLIELEAPKGSLSGEWYSTHHADIARLEKDLAAMSVKTVTRSMHHRRKYFVSGGAECVEIEIVRPVHNTEFCAHCNRLRLSSDGRLVPCLFRGERGVDILGPLRKGASDAALAGLFREAVAQREPYWSAGGPSAREKAVEMGTCQ